MSSGCDECARKSEIVPRGSERTLKLSNVPLDNTVAVTPVGPSACVTVTAVASTVTVAVTLRPTRSVLWRFMFPPDGGDVTAVTWWRGSRRRYDWEPGPLASGGSAAPRRF